MYKLIINNEKEIAGIRTFQEGLIPNLDEESDIAGKQVQFFIQYNIDSATDYLKEFSYCLDGDSFNLEVINEENNSVVWRSDNYFKFNNINLIQDTETDFNSLVYMATFNGYLN